MILSDYYIIHTELLNEPKMVSQKFMDILYQQPDYTNPSTSSSSSNADSNEHAMFQMKRKDDNHMVMPSTSDNFIIDNTILEPLTIIKEDIEDMNKEDEDKKEEENKDMKKEENIKIKEEKEDNYDGLHIFNREIKKNDSNKQMLTSNKPTNDDNKNLLNPCMSPTSHIKDKESLRPPSKRIRREKIIFDPSDTSNPMQKNHKRKIPSEIKDLPCISDKSKQCTEIPIDVLNKYKEQGDRDLHCEYCGKYMQRLDYLRLHLMKHTGETPYKCPHCKNAYRARWRLNQHLRTHTRNLPYHCPYCCYRGNRSDYLSSHINRIHKNLRKEGSKKPKKDNIANDNKESKVDAIKEENFSESELDTIIKKEEEFPLSCLTNEEYTSNS
ncbi:zinc finger protein 431-like isoform X1 [Portunus trituberculatus]|uniref:zinc finger protein 431-like isoform X1 n=1 Tax=Portunus trituberculatus TaxID=210409 RepID=UPI001E1D10DC|nr:zinc finger protein 431-like isoform X1 [Portunus trituberculatus]